MKKKTYLLYLTALFAVSLFGCTRVTDEDIPSQKVEIETPVSEPVSSISEPTSRYIINKESAITSDLEYFGIEMVNGDVTLALSDLCAIFPDEEQYYLYFRMPEDNEYDAYRINSMCINGRDHVVELLEIDGSYQKYAISDWTVSADNVYEISEIHFRNEKDPADTQTYNMSQECVVYINDEQYYFSQEHRYHITLAGRNIEAVYQFNKEKNVFQDLWYNLIEKPEGLDEDNRSFFYFAFNCYDVDRDIKFTPDEILQLDVKYDQLTYAYEGKEKAAAENPDPQIKAMTQRIEPDNIKVVSDSKYSNKKIYEYDTIYRLDDATLEQNKDAENATTLEFASREYEWAVAFGDRWGYTHRTTKDNGGTYGLLSKNYDVQFTQIEDFNAIHIVYRHDGKVFDLNTNSLIADTPTTIVEPAEKPTRDEREKYRKEVIMQDDELNWLEKFIAIYHIKGWVIGIALAVALILIVRFWIKSKIQKKQIKAAVRDWIEDADSDGIKDLEKDVFKTHRNKDEDEK